MTGELGASSSTALHQRTGVRQFVKFCIVGASSTAISFGIYGLLVEVLHLDEMLGVSLVVARPIALAIAFLVSVVNGFFWNNRWTFRKGDSEGAPKRFALFVTTNVVGLLLNQLIVNLVANAFPVALRDQMSRASGLKDPAGFIGLAIATVVVVAWNFTASKYWTFRQ